MRFDMSRAWNDAIASIGANREVMMIVAGVFFLLPSLVFSFLFSDLQTKAIADMQQIIAGQVPANAGIGGLPASYFIVAFIASFVQLVGFIALLALLDDRQRPTVGEALAIGVKFLPTLIGTVVIFVIGYVVSALLVGGAIGLLAAALNVPALSVVFVLLYVIAIVYVMVKLSLTLAVVVFERQYNPFTALVRSWKLTKSNSLRLFGFYLLLFLVYLVISVIISGILLALVTGIFASGSVGLFIAALVSGLVSAAANMLFTGISAAIYRQLAGPSTANLNETFG